SLVSVDGEAFTLFGSAVEHEQGSALAGRGQCSAIAVRQHAAAVGNQFRSLVADGPAKSAVLLRDRVGFIEESSKDVSGGQSLGYRLVKAALHPVQRPEEIDRRRPAGPQPR